MPQTANLLPRFADALARSMNGTIYPRPTPADLLMERADDLDVVYAPFDHVEAGARLVVLGITPGRVQAENAAREARRVLSRGGSVEEASRSAKLVGSFSGPMRSNLLAMLDHIGVPRALDVAGSADLFDPARGLVHFTSCLRYPVFVGGENYNGAPDMLRHPLLRRMVDTYLAAEARALGGALWLPLGPKPTAALNHLVSTGVIDAARVLSGLPHPSGANAERIAYFLGRKGRADLSAKTRPEALDDARESLRARVSSFVGRVA